MSEYYLKPKVGAPSMLRKQRNGQFVNPPLMMKLGGFKSASDIKRDGPNLNLEKGGPQAKGSKPL
jgi:hypothetical protein